MLIFPPQELLRRLPDDFASPSTLLVPPPCCQQSPGGLPWVMLPAPLQPEELLARGTAVSGQKSRVGW